MVQGEFLEKLQLAGLSEKQARVYLACLELGRSSVTNIAFKAEIGRTTAYDVLRSLVVLGFVSISGKQPKEEYHAQNPKKILSLLKQEQEKKLQQIDGFSGILPELEGLFRTSTKPQVKYYEGTEGLLEIYEDTLNAKNHIYSFASVEDTQHALPGYFPKYFYRRAKKNIKMHAIFPDTPEARDISSKNKEQLRESVLVPLDQFSISPQIDIYNNKVLICSWKEKLGIVIESQEIADAMKKVFDLSWKGAQGISKEASNSDKSSEM